jgi:hypothetical protein
MTTKREPDVNGRGGGGGWMGGGARVKQGTEVRVALSVPLVTAFRLENERQSEEAGRGARPVELFHGQHAAPQRLHELLRIFDPQRQARVQLCKEGARMRRRTHARRRCAPLTRHAAVASKRPRPRARSIGPGLRVRSGGGGVEGGGGALGWVSAAAGARQLSGGDERKKGKSQEK